METEVLRTERNADGDRLIGSLIDGKYRVDALIGEGGMGKVYRGTNIRTESPVAIKTLIPDLVRDDTLVRRFEVEAKSASNLRHPNTIRIYDFGREGDLLFMVMELLDGYPLEKIAGEEPIDPLRVIHIFRQTCKSLAEAHDAGMVHRDLKPDNIFLNRVGGDAEFVKVLDFGVAKLQDNKYTDATLTQAGMIFGTPRYMSPEQARAEQIDRRSDIYALGVILYECLTGRVPFDGRDPISILIQHVNEKPKPFAVINPALPAMPDLEAITLRCMAKSADERYASVTELLTELERVERRLLGNAAADEFGATQAMNSAQVPVTRRQAAATAVHTPSGSNAFDALGVGGSAHDPTMQLGDGTLHLGAPADAATRSGFPLPAVIGVTVAVLALAGFGLVSIFSGDDAVPAAAAEAAAAVAATEPTPSEEAPAADPVDGDPAEVAALDPTPSRPANPNDAIVQALGAERVRSAVQRASGAAQQAVVSIEIAAPSGVEGATVTLEGREPTPLPTRLLLVRTPDAPGTITLTVQAPGHRDASMELPFQTAAEPVVPTLRRAGSGSSSPGTPRTPGTTRTTPGGLDNPYGR